MATSNPRITITLEPSVHALLQRLSGATGNSMSSMVADLLKESAPIFERMARVIEAAAEAQDLAKVEMVGGMERAQAKLEKQLGLALETMDEGFRPILEEAEKVRRRAAGAGGSRLRGAPGRKAVAGTPTPISNRGVTPSTRAKKPAKRGA